VRTAAVGVLAILLASAVLVADDHSVIFDEDVDFTAFKTFTMRNGRMTSDRPELNFPVVLEVLGGVIRKTLITKGLKEGDDRADLVVEYSVNAVDFSIGPFGRANQMRGGRGRGGASQADFTEATLVLDLKRRDPEALLWRGVYRDAEPEPGKLAELLPRDAATLLVQYPPRRRR
jgi:hypothetical protein